MARESPAYPNSPHATSLPTSLPRTYHVTNAHPFASCVCVLSSPLALRAEPIVKWQKQAKKAAKKAKAAKQAKAAKRARRAH